MRLLSYDKLRDKGVGYTREHLARLVKAGKFPVPIVLSRRPNGSPARIAWAEDEVDAWIAGLVAKRDEDSAAPRRARAPEPVEHAEEYAP